MDVPMSDRPWLAAIVPYNGERWLGSALQSIAVQAEPGIEVIVVDSSDSENSLDIVQGLTDRLPIRLHRRPDLTSWMEKTNFAAAATEADWICMLHQDDLWEPSRLAAIRKWIGGHAQRGAVMHLHAAHLIDENGRRIGSWRCPLPAGGVPHQLLLQRLLVQNSVAIPTPTIRREAYLNAGGLDRLLWYTADWDLYLKLAALGDVHYHPEPLACFRVHGGSLTMTGWHNEGEFRHQMETVLDRHIGRLATGHDAILGLARASIEVNVALAAASRGSLGRLLGAGLRLCALGPRQGHRYVRDSRILDRALPRLRARLAGAL